jgi:hypothetical protein
MILEFPNSIKIKPDSLEDIKEYFVKFKYLEETVDKTDVVIAEINQVLKLIETIHIWKTNKKVVNTNLKLIKNIYKILQEAYDGYELKENEKIVSGTNYKKVFIYTNSKNVDIKETFNIVLDYKLAHYIYIDFTQITVEEAYSFGLHYENKNTFYTNLNNIITLGISGIKIKSEEDFITLVKKRESE